MRKAIDTTGNVTRNGMIPRDPVWNLTDVDDIFARALRHPFSLLDELSGSLQSREAWFQPQVDVEEGDDAFLLSVDLPGTRKEDVRVDLQDNVLTVCGERKLEDESERDGIRRHERMYGKFQRSFTLPATVDVDKVEANMEDGVLRIALLKSEAVKPRAIEVKSGRTGFFSRLIGSRKDGKESQKTNQKTGEDKTDAH